MLDVASSLRQWRRWWGRARELGVVLLLLDPVALSGVLTKASDAIAKTNAHCLSLVGVSS